MIYSNYTQLGKCTWLGQKKTRIQGLKKYGIVMLLQETSSTISHEYLSADKFIELGT